MEKLLIVDASNLIKRCYHAIEPRFSDCGIQVNSIYGYLRTLINETAIFNFDGIFNVFDTKTSSDWRKAIYPFYKANRKPKTEKEVQDKEIINQQTELLFNLLAYMNLSPLKHKGLEADDIIASLCNQLKEDYQLFILSADKDLVQLIDTNVTLIRPKTAYTKKMVINLKTFNNYFPDLLNPKQIVDLKVLSGDNSDNISGLTKVGEKTAIKILKEYNSVEQLLYVPIADPKLRNKIEAEKEVLERNLKLIPLTKFVKIPNERLIFSKPDFKSDKYLEIYNKYNIHPWVD